MMTGIRFMDDLTCPRRSTVHPSQLQRRESNDGESPSPHAPSDEADRRLCPARRKRDVSARRLCRRDDRRRRAVGDDDLGRTFSAASAAPDPPPPQIANDIRSATEKYKAQYRQTEEDAAKDIPLLFREFKTASEEGREPLLVRASGARAHRRHAHDAARSTSSSSSRRTPSAPRRRAGTSGSGAGCRACK